ncbi:hypothetical protein F2Q68_00033388 [Brassica cretica]|uniref:Uncharacterized protein n=1 Tax=Brassica cretica TaxID=69181 RepID=A0A8S9H786_BRACR|nr:hypothetical protein F2Q68_00033388 [Brassica cretica]
MRKSTEIPAKASGFVKSEEKTVKPPFRLAVDDTKPVLQDPVKKNDLDSLSLSLSLSLATILRSDPMETEEAVLRLPSFPVVRPSKS